ncbi:hypothetical protein T06_1000 [Trichinella sp. T6]|nr:hypothetical protein T06_1000 [Trichinella sp. T6]
MASRSCNRLVHQTQGLLTWKLPCICHGSADDPKENTTGAWGSNYQITATTKRGVRTQSQKVTRGWASDSDYVEGSKHDVQLPLKPSVSKLIQVF